MDKNTLKHILTSWFDNGRYIKADKDYYGDVRYVGLHDGRCSEVVTNDDQPNKLKVYQINNGGSYLNAFCSSHEEKLRLIGMLTSKYDFKFESERNYNECHTTITMIK